MTGPDEGPPLVHPHLAYFFVPLPEPLGLPDGYVLVCGSPDATPHLAASLKFHRATSGSAGDETSLLFRLAERVLPGAGPVAEDAGPDRHRQEETEPEPGASGQQPEPGRPPPGDRTVVEMAVACDLGDEDAMSSLSDAFDRGLGYVREAQRAYYLARRRPLTLAARESMPFAVPVAVRRLHDDHGDPLPFRVSPSMYLLNMNLHAQVREADLDDRELEGLPTALWQQSRPGFVTDYLEFVRESQVALELQGSYRTAVLFAATACEVLLDSLLAHLLWEEGTRPEDAAPVFDTWLTARVKREYHNRIGGQWDTTRPGPVADWSTLVAGLRNRVVHGGHEPALAEARTAGDASATLSTHLGDLLAERVDAYPRTANVLPGEHGLRRRGRWTAAVEALTRDPAEVNWIDTFSRWRTALQRARADTARSDPTGPRRPFAVVRPGGALQWVVHDAANGMAAVVPKGQLDGVTTLQLAALERARPALGTAGQAQVVAVEGATCQEPSPRDWVSEYRLVPGTGVMVRGEDLDPA